MSRHEGDFRNAAEAPLTLEELVALLRGAEIDDDQRRQAAIACYLSAGDGWREAMKRLDGAFAPQSAELRERKSD